MPLWWYIFAMCSAVVIIGIAKSGFGGGVGILAVPLMANALPVDEALGVMLPILIAADIVAVWQHRGHQDRRHLRFGLIGAALGIGIGTVILIVLQQIGSLQVTLKAIVGGICVLLVVIQCYRLVGGKVPRIPDTMPAGVGAGGLAGVASTLAHSAGPIMSIYLLEHKLPKRLLVGTLVLLFFLINCMKLPTFVFLDYITFDRLKESLVLALLVPVGSLLGIWMHKRIPEKPFAFVMYVGAGLAGANMIYQAILP